MGFGRGGAFPEPKDLTHLDEATWRSKARVGYRAKSAGALVSMFAEDDGRIERELRDLDAHGLSRWLQALPGFGPYAAGQGMRLLGKFDSPALDSWCRSRLAELTGREREDAKIESVCDEYGESKGLVLWLDITRDWHESEGDGEHRQELARKFAAKRRRKAPARGKRR